SSTAGRRCSPGLSLLQRYPRQHRRAPGADLNQKRGGASMLDRPLQPAAELSLHINPSVSAFKVAAARVVHCSLRKMLSTCVPTVLGLIPSRRATALLLAPWLMCCRIWLSRLVNRLLQTLA